MDLDGSGDSITGSATNYTAFHVSMMWANSDKHSLWSLAFHVSMMWAYSDKHSLWSLSYVSFELKLNKLHWKSLSMATY